MTEQRQYPVDAGMLSDLQHELGSRNEPARDLLSVESIRGRTDISEEERMLLSQLHVLSRRFYEPDIMLLSEFIQDYLEYGPSVERKGRLEFIDALKAWAGMNKNDEKTSVQEKPGRRL
jgi:hypothetical protein